MNDKYDCKVNFLELLTVIKKVPNHWKYHLVMEPEVEYTYTIETQSFTCKELYMKLLLNKTIYPESHAQYWCTNLEVEVDDMDCIESYQEVFKLTVSSKLRSFYYQNSYERHYV